MTELVQFRGCKCTSLLFSSKSCPVRLPRNTLLTIGRGARGFIRTLEAQGEPVAEFDERLWGAMMDYVTVGADGGMTVVFRDGTGIHT